MRTHRRSEARASAPEFRSELVGYCGFYCGCCPTYLGGACGGCLEAHQDGDCFTNTCVRRKGLRFCGECETFPCEEIISRENAPDAPTWPGYTVLDREWLKWKRRERSEGR